MHVSTLIRPARWTSRRLRHAAGPVGLILSFGVMLPALAAQEPSGPAVAEAPAESALPEALVGVRGVRPDMSREELFELARGMLGDVPDHDSAIAILTELARGDGNDLRTFALLAGAYEMKSSATKRTGDAASAREAEALLDRAVELYLYAGALAVRLDHDRDAADLYGRILVYRPSHPEALLGVARAFAATQRQMMAIERYRDYLKTPLTSGPSGPAGRTRTHADTDSQAHLELGRLYRKSNFFGQATASLLAAEKINPQNPEIHVELARVYRETREFAKAAAAAERAVSRTPSNPEYRSTYATILLAQEAVRPALEHAAAAIELAKQMLSERANQPDLLQSIQNYYRVYQETLVVYLNAEPKDVNARLQLAQAMQEQGELGQLLNLHHVLRLLTTAPQDSENLRLLEAVAQTQYRVGNLPDAAATCQRIVKLDPDNKLASEILERLPDQLKSDPAVPSTGNNPAPLPGTIGDMPAP